MRLSDDIIDDAGLCSFVGWEKNEQEKMIPRVANMAASMDPERYALFLYCLFSLFRCNYFVFISNV